MVHIKTRKKISGIFNVIATAFVFLLVQGFLNKIFQSKHVLSPTITISKQTIIMIIGIAIIHLGCSRNHESSKVKLRAWGVTVGLVCLVLVIGEFMRSFTLILGPLEQGLLLVIALVLYKVSYRIY